VLHFDADAHAAEVEGIGVLQYDKEILRLVEDVRRFGMYKVRWKESIRQVNRLKAEG
jgi:hypothetical protein